jgi:bZIP transcription factor
VLTSQVRARKNQPVITLTTRATLTSRLVYRDAQVLHPSPMMGSSDDDAKAAAAAAKAASLRDLQGQPSPSKRKKAATDDEDDDDTGSDSDDNDNDGGKDGEGKAYASSGGDSQHRREKRLAMNRESARARRKRKKVLIESLEEQVAGLSEQNRNLSGMVEALLGKVRQLESELALSVLGRQQQQHQQQHQQPPTTLHAAGIGQQARDVGSQEASLLRILHQGPQHSRLMVDPTQLRAGESFLRRGGPFDFRSLAAGAGDMEAAAAAAAAAWDPYRTQLIGNNPSSMLLPSLQNTVRLLSRAMGMCVVHSQVRTR